MELCYCKKSIGGRRRNIAWGVLDSFIADYATLPRLVFSLPQGHFGGNSGERGNARRARKHDKATPLG